MEHLRKRRSKNHSRSERRITEHSAEETILCPRGLFNLRHLLGEMMYPQYAPLALRRIFAFPSTTFHYEYIRKSFAEEVKSLHFSNVVRLTIGISDSFSYRLVWRGGPCDIASNTKTDVTSVCESAWTFQKRQAQIPSMTFEGVPVHRYTLVCLPNVNRISLRATRVA